MKYGSQNTVGSLLSIPQRRILDLSHVSNASIAKQMLDWMPTASAVNPDNEAIEFYALNQAVTMIEQHFGRHAVLPEDALTVVREYRKVLTSQVHRLTVYTMLVTTRESRHLHSGMGETWWKSMVNKYGLRFREFNESIHGKGSDGSAQWYKTNPPQMECGRYMRGLAELFNTGKFSGGYGGKPWGMIAHTLAEFLNGCTSAEMFVDTAYTLAHNNGPMFNKGMLYTMYSQELYKILDIQRAGRVVEYVLESKKQHRLVAMLSKLLLLLPDKFAEYVDYYEVEAKGALKQYPQEKKTQVLKYGDPPSVALAKKKAEEEKLKQIELEKAEAASKMEVWPGTFVKIIKRAA